MRGRRRTPSCSIAARRLFVRAVVAGLAFGAGAGRAFADCPRHAPERRFYEAAVRMRRLAESWGDQSYGAVLVVGGAIAGEGPSRVVKLGDANAHAEREAIKDAQRKLGRFDLAGAVLYSTSRPCRACETAAERAGVACMIFGDSLEPAGPPRA